MSYLSGQWLFNENVLFNESIMFQETCFPVYLTPDEHMDAIGTYPSRLPILLHDIVKLQ